MKPVCLDDFGGEFKHSGSQINYRTCPACGSNGWKVYVNPDTGAWICFAGDCGAKGRVRVSVEPSALIRKLHGVKSKPQEWHEVGLPPYEPLGPEAVAFLQRYGMTGEDAKRFLLVQGTGEMAGRILIPYCNALGEVVYWNSRTYQDQEPKYMTMGGRHPLYVPGYINKHKASYDALVLVEGAFDAMKVHLHTNYKAAALGGKHLPKHLLGSLLEICRGDIIVALDSDALASSIGLMRSLEPFAKSVSFRILPQGQDPGSMSPQQLREIFS